MSVSESDTEQGSVSVSDSDDVSVSGSDTDTEMKEEWKRVSDELQRLSEFHSSILKRMEKLSIRTTALDTDIQQGIKECHHTALNDLEQTGEITFGQRLLQWFDRTPSVSYTALSVKKN